VVFVPVTHMVIPSFRYKFMIMFLYDMAVYHVSILVKLKKVRLRTTFASMDTSSGAVKLSCCEHYGNVLHEYSDPELRAVRVECILIIWSTILL